MHGVSQQFRAEPQRWSDAILRIAERRARIMGVGVAVYLGCILLGELPPIPADEVRAEAAGNLGHDAANNQT
jgi:hypothetical protein